MLPFRFTPSIGFCLPVSRVSPVVAASNRHFGTKVTLLVGTTLVSTAWLCASFASQVWHLFMTVGLTFGWVSGS